MKQLLMIAVLCVIALPVGFTVRSSRQLSVTVHAEAQALAQVLPKGFPRTPRRMAELLQAPADDGRRADAWRLFAELTEGGVVRWESEKWANKCDLFLTPMLSACKAYSSVQKPEKTSAARPAATVFYNDAAAHAIKAGALASGPALLSMIQNGDASVPDQLFPRSSIVVKGVWEGFTDDAAPMKLKVYDSEKVTSTAGNLPDISNWKNTVLLKVDHGQVDRTAPCQAGDYASMESGTPDPVPLNCFFWKPSGGPCFNIALFGTVSGVSGPSPVASKPCTLVLVGIQIITKEVPQWVWSTFWWTNRYHGWKTEGRPRNLSGAFSHFAMDTMIGSENTTTLPVFNPYLEGPQAHGTQSNCLRCHARAAFTPNCPIQRCPHAAGTRIGIRNPESGVGSTKPLSHCAAGESETPEGPCQLQTGFLWSITTNQDLESMELPLRFSIPGVIPVLPGSHF